MCIMGCGKKKFRNTPLVNNPVLTIQWSDLHRLNFKCPSFICPPYVTDIAYLQHLHFFYIYSVNIKFGTKFIIALCDVFRKITRTSRLYFEKCHHVTCNLFKWRHWFLRNDVITNFLKGNPHFFVLFRIDFPTT
jgi:hypothetical protein